MRKSSFLWLISGLLLALAGPVGAATLSGSEMSVAIGALPPIAIPQSTDPLSVSVASDGSFSLAASSFGPESIVLPQALFTGVNLVSGLTIAGLANASQPVAVGGGPGGALGGVGPLAGAAFVNVIQLFNLTIPLSPVGGSTGASVMVATGGISITVIGRPWGTGPQSITGLATTTPGTAVVNTITISGNDFRVTPSQGAVTLVSAFQVLTNVAGNLPGIATQSLRFVPEPTSALLFGIGGAVLGLAGIVRLRR